MLQRRQLRRSYSTLYCGKENPSFFWSLFFVICVGSESESDTHSQFHHKQAIKKTSSSDPTFYNNRAQCYLKLGQFRRALDDCDAALRLNGTSSE